MDDRSGSTVASELAARRELDLSQCHALSSIVHAACLAHDIGNPPFGHGGEDAIQGLVSLATRSCFRGSRRRRRRDLLRFDGNAQGFRNLTAARELSLRRRAQAHPRHARLPS